MPKVNAYCHCCKNYSITFSKCYLCGAKPEYMIEMLTPEAELRSVIDLLAHLNASNNWVLTNNQKQFLDRCIGALDEYEYALQTVLGDAVKKEPTEREQTITVNLIDLMRVHLYLTFIHTEHNVPLPLDVVKSMNAITTEGYKLPQELIIKTAERIGNES